VADYIPTPEPIEENAEIESVQPPQSRRRGIVVVVVVILALVAAGIWWRSTYSESTDDAQVNGHLIQVSSRVAGQVAKVYVDENQVVKAGDVIAELDPSDYKVGEENAEAALASAQANAAAANVNVPITTVNTGSNLSAADANVSGSHAAVEQAEQQLDAAKAANTKAQADLERYKPLVEKDVISKLQFDAAVAAADAARHSEQAARDGVKVAREREAQAQAGLKFAQTAPEQVAAQSARARQAQAMVAQAQAQLDMARLNLSYTKIVAPKDGIITRKSVEINQNVAPGQNLLMLISLEGLWVTANFKETQLRHMYAGQAVEIDVDSTGKTYHGKVTQIGGATGSVLSLFPPENATGNYVKVVQRVPVRIDFADLAGEDPSHELRPGLSVEPKVSVK
jgi:membrane fusion protein (multidrug efflux system)